MASDLHQNLYKRFLITESKVTIPLLNPVIQLGSNGTVDGIKSGLEIEGRWKAEIKRGRSPLGM